MRDYRISSPNGVKLYDGKFNAKCIRKFSLMNEDSITLAFSLRNAIDFPVGSSVGDFFVTKTQIGTWNANTGEWDYALKFDAYYWAWVNKLLKYIIPGATTARETSFTLTATIDVHASMLKNCLDSLGLTYNGSPFRIDTSDTSLSAEPKLVRYENLSVLGGIQAIAEAFECEWWVDGNAVCFGKCEKTNGSNFVFEAGKNVSSISFSQGKTEAPNRLYVFGSDRNLPSNYRQTNGNDTIGGVVNKRLMLPEGIPYLQTEENLPESQIVEQVVVLDDVYPKLALTISEEPETYVSEVENNDGTTTRQTFYRIKYGDKFPFLSSYILPNEELHIIFTSGRLNGMDFGAKFNPKGFNEKDMEGNINPDAQMFEIVANEDYGRMLPDDTLKPEKGDTFVLYGWDTTKMNDLGLIANAENELFEEGKKQLEEIKKDLSTCTCPMAWDYMKPLLAANKSPKPGDAVTVIDTAHFGDGGRRSRIIGFEFSLDQDYASYTYICGENVSVSRLNSIESKIDGLAKSGTKVQIQNSLDFLSKRYADSTPYALNVGGLLTLGKGTISRSFAEGLTGFGFKITDNGDIYADSLTLRKFLEVPELRYNRTEVTVGNQWQAPGAGIVEYYSHHGSTVVDQGDGTEATCNIGWITLKLEEGEIGSLSVGDFCMGIWHFSADNETEDSDDNCGNFKFAGFRTLYFYVYEVEGERNERLHVRTRSFYPTEPVAGLHFVAFGNDTRPERQQSAYRTRTYTRWLANVNSWNWGVDNIMMQLGDCSGLVINGTSLEKYSGYLNNVYFSGVLQNVDFATAPLNLSYETFGDTYVGVKEDGTNDSCAIQLQVTRGFANVTDKAQIRLTDGSGTVIKTGEVTVGDVSADSLSRSLIVSPSFLGSSTERTLVITAEYKHNGDSTLTATARIIIRDRSLLKGENGTSYSPNLLVGTKTGPESWGTDYPSDCVKEVVVNSAGFAEYYDRIIEGEHQHTGYTWLQEMVAGGMSSFGNGRRYTLSFDYMASREMRIGLRFRKTHNDTISQLAYTVSVPASDSWRRASLHFNLDGFNTEFQHLLFLETVDNTVSGDVFALRKICLCEGDSDVWTPAEVEMTGKDGQNGKDGEDAVLYQFVTDPSIFRLRSDGRFYGDSESVTIGCFKYVGTKETRVNVPRFGIVGNTNERVQYKIAYDSGATDWSDAVSPLDVITDSQSLYPKLYLRVVKGDEGSLKVLSPEHIIGYVCDGEEGVQGDPGEVGPVGPVGPAGAVIRLCGKWEAGRDYNDGTVDEDGVRYIDTVYVMNGNVEEWYKCVRKHTSNASNAPSSAHATWWSPMSNVGDIVADLLVANQLFADYVTTREIQIIDSDKRVCGRLGSVLDGFVMWLGAAGAADSTFAIMEDGQTRFGKRTGSRIVIDPTNREINVYDGNNLNVVQIDGKTSSLDTMYGATDNLLLTRATSVHSSDTEIKLIRDAGKSFSIRIPKGQTAEVAISVDVTMSLEAKNRPAAPASSGVVEMSLMAGSSVSASISADNTISSDTIENDTRANGSLTGAFATDGLAASNGVYTKSERETQTVTFKGKFSAPATADRDITFKLNLTVRGESATTGNVSIRTSPSASLSNYSARFKAGNSPKSHYGQNGLTVANSTQDYVRAGVQDGAFLFEAASDTAGLRVDGSNGVRMRSETGLYDQRPVGCSTGYIADANLAIRSTSMGVTMAMTGETTHNLPSGAGSQYGGLTTYSFAAYNHMQEFRPFCVPSQLWTRRSLDNSTGKCNWSTWERKY